MWILYEKKRGIVVAMSGRHVDTLVTAMDMENACEFGSTIMTRDTWTSLGHGHLGRFRSSVSILLSTLRSS
jgi:hypothetical protein